MTNDQVPQSYLPAKPDSTMAIASLVLSLLGWTVLPGIGAIAGVITGHMAKKEIRESMGSLGGEGMATAGLILGYTNIVLGLCVICMISIFLLFGLGLLSSFSSSTVY